MKKEINKKKIRKLLIISISIVSVLIILSIISIVFNAKSIFKSDNIHKTSELEKGGIRNILSVFNPRNLAQDVFINSDDEFCAFSAGYGYGCGICEEGNGCESCLVNDVLNSDSGESDAAEVVCEVCGGDDKLNPIIVGDSCFSCQNTECEQPCEECSEELGSINPFTRFFKKISSMITGRGVITEVDIDEECDCEKKSKLDEQRNNKNLLEWLKQDEDNMVVLIESLKFEELDEKHKEQLTRAFFGGFNAHFYYPAYDRVIQGLRDFISNLANEHSRVLNSHPLMKELNYNAKLALAQRILEREKITPQPTTDRTRRIRSMNLEEASNHLKDILREINYNDNEALYLQTSSLLIDVYEMDERYLSAIGQYQLIRSATCEKGVKAETYSGEALMHIHRGEYASGEYELALQNYKQAILIEKEILREKEIASGLEEGKYFHIEYFDDENPEAEGYSYGTSQRLLKIKILGAIQKKVLFERDQLREYYRQQMGFNENNVYWNGDLFSKDFLGLLFIRLGTAFTADIEMVEDYQLTSLKYNSHIVGIASLLAFLEEKGTFDSIKQLEGSKGDELHFNLKKEFASLSHEEDSLERLEQDPEIRNALKERLREIENNYDERRGWVFYREDLNRFLKCVFRIDEIGAGPRFSTFDNRFRSCIPIYEEDFEIMLVQPLKIKIGSSRIGTPETEEVNLRNIAVDVLGYGDSTAGNIKVGVYESASRGANSIRYVLSHNKDVALLFSDGNIDDFNRFKNRWGISNQGFNGGLSNEFEAFKSNYNNPTPYIDVSNYEWTWGDWGRTLINPTDLALTFVGAPIVSGTFRGVSYTTRGVSYLARGGTQSMIVGAKLTKIPGLIKTSERYVRMVRGIGGRGVNIVSATGQHYGKTVGAVRNLGTILGLKGLSAKTVNLLACGGTNVLGPTAAGLGSSAIAYPFVGQEGAVAIGSFVGFSSFSSNLHKSLIKPGRLNKVHLVGPEKKVVFEMRFKSPEELIKFKKSIGKEAVPDNQVFEYTPTGSQGQKINLILLKEGDYVNLGLRMSYTKSEYANLVKRHIRDADEAINDILSPNVGGKKRYIISENPNERVVDLIHESPIERMSYTQRFISFLKSPKILRGGRITRRVESRYGDRYGDTLKELSKLRKGEYMKLPDDLDDEGRFVVKCYITTLGQKYHNEYLMVGLRNHGQEKIGYYISRGEWRHVRHAFMSDIPGHYETVFDFHTHPNGNVFHGDVIPSGNTVKDYFKVNDPKTGQYVGNNVYNVGKGDLGISASHSNRYPTAQIGIVKRNGDIIIATYKTPTDQIYARFTNMPRFERLDFLSDDKFNVPLMEYLYGPDWRIVAQAEKYTFEALSNLRHPDGFPLIEGMSMKELCNAGP